jgi:lipopolysaccharide transport system permease protein
MQHLPVKNQNPSISFGYLISSLINHRKLIIQMVYREIIGRYKGSVFGLAWSFFNPIMMLLVYTFVFSVIFKAKMGGSDSKTLFATMVFVGVIVLNLFAEVLNRSPNLIIDNVNYVKKVVFPLEVLPVIVLLSSFFHALISFSVLIIAYVVINGHLNWTIIFTPLVFFPLVLITLGLSWVLSALGVYLRDIGQSIGILVTVLMFLSPVFYPISAVPDEFKALIMANPLTYIIDQAREVIIWGHLPDWYGLGIYTIVAVLVFWLGFVIFQKTRKGFADVL